MNVDLRLQNFPSTGRVQVRSLERLCDQLDTVASAQGRDRAVALPLIDRLREQEQSREDMIRSLATALLIVVEQEVAAQKACLHDIPSIFTTAFNQPATSTLSISSGQAG